MTALAQRSFVAGELSPSLYARTDRQKYAEGLRTCRNFIVQQHGGVANRAGTEFVAETKDSTRVARLIPWIYNDDQTYVLEFGHLYMRIHKDGAPVLSAGVPYEIVTPYAEADLISLQTAQTADVMTIAHKLYAPRNLSRLGETNWTLTLIAFGPAIASPTNFTRASGGLVSFNPTAWYVTAISSATGEESLAASYSANFVGDPANAVVLTWTAVAGVSEYRLYREYQSRNYAGSVGAGSVGFIGTAKTATFSDTNTAANYEINPPRVSQRADFNAAGEYPAAVNYYQQRQLFGGSTLDPETVWASRTSGYGNFISSTPSRDDDGVEFTLAGRQVNEIRHLLDLDPLFIFTSGGEWVVRGDEAGILTPTGINARQFSYHGIHEYLDPLMCGTIPLFVQARGNAVRKLLPKSETEDAGADLTLFAKHLFRDHTIVDWDFQEIPNSVVWAVRSDGKLLGLTFLPNEDIWGWHWHDTDGTVERVCVIPEGIEDSVYLIVKRTINGATKRYVERIAVRRITDVDDMVFMDSCLSYDGWNTAATTMTLSGGTTWEFDNLLTLTASASTFVAGDVGNIFIIVLKNAAGVETDRIRLTVAAYTSGAVVTGHPDKLVPTTLRSVARSTWARAVDEVSGLTHLAAKNVSVLGDGTVVSSPNNSDYPTLTVSAGGVLTLAKPYAVVNVGLPYISDLETLDIDSADRGTIKDRFILVNKVGLFVEAARGIWVGQPDQPTDADPLNGMQEYKARSAEDYDSPVDLKTDSIEVSIESRWNSNGRVLVRQVDPLPLTVLSIMPMGNI